MINNQEVIHYSLSLFDVFAGTGLLFGCIVSVFFQRRSHSQNGGRKQDLGWYVPGVGCNGEGSSFFHRWDVRYKCTALFFHCFCIAFLTTPQMAGVAFSCSFFVLLAARLSLKRALKRLFALLPFLAMFLLIMPLTAQKNPGDLLMMIDPLPITINVRGVLLAVTITLKASAIALLMEPLFNTAPLSVTVNGLQKIGIPSQVCQMMLMAHRYIFVFLHEAKRMTMAMKVRGFRKRTNLVTLRVLGIFVGMLMVRSIDRTERVYQAMLARGYNGTFPTYHTYKSVSRDWQKAMVWIALGVIFLLLDSSKLI